MLCTQSGYGEASSRASSSLRATTASAETTTYGPSRTAEGLNAAVAAEDDVGFRGRELASLRRVPSLDDQRMALRAARRVEPAGDVEIAALMAELTGAAPCEPAGDRVGGNVISRP
jgi:hypothetical protein